MQVCLKQSNKSSIEVQPLEFNGMMVMRPLSILVSFDKK